HSRALPVLLFRSLPRPKPPAAKWTGRGRATGANSAAVQEPAAPPARARKAAPTGAAERPTADRAGMGALHGPDLVGADGVAGGPSGGGQGGGAWRRSPVVQLLFAG